MDKGHAKILFRLEKDDDDYPPDDWESLWGLALDNGLFAIDNVPFYVRGISVGDIVSVDRRGDELFFRELVKLSEHSVIRVIVFEMSESERLKESLVKLSCEFEGSHIEGFLAFDCPPDANYKEVERYLRRGEDEGRWEYEVASLRYKLN